VVKYDSSCVNIWVCSKDIWLSKNCIKGRLEGLPWAENNLLNEVSFQVEEDDDDDKELLSPQIFILSSGDITPFKLTFSFKPDFDEPVYFEVTGDFTAPITVNGPLDSIQ
jgi:general secretion pathway protein H